jgi:hypothetical protein
LAGRLPKSLIEVPAMLTYNPRIGHSPRPQTHPFSVTANRMSPIEDTARVELVLFRADVGTTHNELALVSCADGNLRILRDGHALDDRTWPPTELDDCIDAFRQVAHASAHSAGTPN